MSLTHPSRLFLRANRLHHPAATPRPRASTSSFSTTSPAHRSSPLFALSSLSNSRETQHFNKLSNLSRIEHSPNLKLIQSSEVDPYPLPTPPLEDVNPAGLPPQLPPRHTRSSFDAAAGRSARHVWDTKALRAGRAILADQARQVHGIRRAMQRSRRQEARVMAEKAAWEQESLEWQQMVEVVRAENNSGAVLLALMIMAGTALAVWWVWPRQTGLVDDSAAGEGSVKKGAKKVGKVKSKGKEKDEAVNSVPAMTPGEALGPTRQRTWWKGLFWAQQ